MIEQVKKDKKTGRVTFVMKGISPAFANTFRRLITESVPTMAIEEVEFRQNTSALYDEMIAHRLGLVPLTTDLKSYDVKGPEDEYSAKNSLKLSLKMKGPCTVLASDLKSQDPKVVAAHPDIPIVTLLKGQELEFEATAILGKGKQHVKFSPGLVWYTYKPTAKVNNNHADFEEFKDKFPPQVFKDGKIDAKLIEEHDLFEACDNVHPEIVKIERDESTIVFNIEPWGQLAPGEILAAAAADFDVMLKEFAEAFSNA